MFRQVAATAALVAVVAGCSRGPSDDEQREAASAAAKACMDEFVAEHSPALNTLHDLPDEDLDVLTECANRRLSDTAPDWNCTRTGCFPWRFEVVNKRGYSWEGEGI